MPIRSDGFARPSPLDGDARSAPDPVDVEGLERVRGEDAVLEIVRSGTALRVVAREAERRLCQVVRPEREEVGVARELTCA